MNSKIKVDRISGLPVNIIDSILIRLPILEAVHTSILSRSWRYQWHSLSKIKIIFIDPCPVSRAALLNKIVKIIDRILLAHCGSVDAFELIIDLDTCGDMDQWILYVSRNDIKELIVNKIFGLLYILPSCLFSCSNLTHLKLTRCILKPPPVAFKAFSNLTELFLHQVEISDNVLEKILNSSPHLSRLSLFSSSPQPIKLDAPKLVMLHIKAFHCGPRFINAPLLTSAFFESCLTECIVNNDDCKNIVELLGSMPILQRLELCSFALQHLAGCDVPACLPLVCPIKHLMVHINSENVQELIATFCIFTSSPFIQYLHLKFWMEERRIFPDVFWKGKEGLSFKFNHLREVKTTGFHGIESEFKFIKFVLANAPALKTMSIEFDQDVECVLAIVTKLIQLPRISLESELIFLDGKDVEWL